MKCFFLFSSSSPSIPSFPFVYNEQAVTLLRTYAMGPKEKQEES